jgi:hypothetical protein
MEGETSLALTHTLVRLSAPSFLFSTLLFSTFLSFDQIRVNLLRSEDFLYLNILSFFKAILQVCHIKVCINHWFISYEVLSFYSYRLHGNMLW